jgi:signal peptidase
MSDGSRDWIRLGANVLGIFVLLAAISPFVVYAVPEVIGADHGLVVLSGSMEPEMSPGDAVIVREVPASEIEQRDIITYQTESDTPTTHRVVEVRQTDSGVAYVTKGDANEEPDQGTVPYRRVVGEVILVIPFIGHVVQFANTQTGFLALVLTPMALFVLSELWELSKAIRASDSEATTAETTDDVPPEAVPATSTPTTDADADAETDDAGGFTLTRSSLQLILLLLGLYVPYSGYVAYTTREAWSIGAATATLVAFLFSLVIYLASRGAGSDAADEGSRSAAGVVRRGELPARIGDRTTVPLESIESLVQMALDRDDWVIYDEEQNTYYMTRDDAVYLHQANPETDGGMPITEAPGASDRDETDPTAGGDAP